VIINIVKLMQELQSAGIACGGCSTDGIVWGTDGSTEIRDRADVASIIAAHDPTETPQPTEAERIAALEAALLELMMGGL